MPNNNKKTRGSQQDNVSHHGNPGVGHGTSSGSGSPSGDRSSQGNADRGNQGMGDHGTSRRSENIDTGSRSSDR